MVEIDKRTLIIDVPNYIEKYTVNPAHYVQEVVFRFVDKYGLEKYLKDYIILFNGHGFGNKYVRELIGDWDLEFYEDRSSKGNPTSKDKYDVIKDVIKRGKDGEALIFFSYPNRLEDMSNKIMVDQIINSPIYTKVCRLDFDGQLI